jgi:transposase
MSRARLVITAVVVEERGVREVARTYGVSPGWVSKLVARYRNEGDTAFEPRSRRPVRSPRSTPPEVVERIVELRQRLLASGDDAGPETIRWHLEQAGAPVSTATILRKLHRAGLVTPQPHKRPRSFYVRFAAELPNETWQADFTHRRRRRARRDPGRVGAPRALLECTTAPSLEVDGAREPGLKAIRERSQRVPPHHRATNTTRGVAERNPPL